MSKTVPIPKIAWPIVLCTCLVFLTAQVAFLTVNKPQLCALRCMSVPIELRTTMSVVALFIAILALYAVAKWRAPGQRYVGLGLLACGFIGLAISWIGQHQCQLCTATQEAFLLVALLLLPSSYAKVAALIPTCFFIGTVWSLIQHPAFNATYIGSLFEYRSYEKRLTHNGDSALVVFTDPWCPACQQFWKDAKIFPDSVKIYRRWVIRPQTREESMNAAVASERAELAGNKPRHWQPSSNDSLEADSPSTTPAQDSMILASVYKDGRLFEVTGYEGVPAVFVLRKWGSQHALRPLSTRDLSRFSKFHRFSFLQRYARR